MSDDLEIGDYAQWYLGNLAGDSVLTRFDSCQAYADNAYTRAIEYIEAMRVTGDTDYAVSVQPMPDVDEPNLESTNAVIPTSPDSTMEAFKAPASITFSEVTMGAIRDMPTLDIDALLNDLMVPLNTFSFMEDSYSSELMTATNDKLQTDVEIPGTGIDPRIEDPIWRRTQERDEQALQEAKDRTSDEWAKRGFSLPDGVLTAQLQELEKTYTDTRLTTSRDISIKQSELAQGNAHFAVEKAISLDSLRANYESQLKERQLQAAKTSIEVAIQLFDAAIRKITIRLEVFAKLIEEVKIEAMVVTEKAKIESELQKNEAIRYSVEVDAFKSMVEAEKVRVTALIDAFKGNVEAYKAITEADSSRIESQVKVFAARIQKAVSLGEIYIKEAELGLTAFVEQQKLRGVLVDAGSRVAAQLAASAMAATNASISLGESDGKHASYSIGKSSTRSSSTNASTSNSHSVNYNYNSNT